MLGVSRYVELSMVWLVNGGSCHFLFDNWVGIGALFLRRAVESNPSFHDFIINGNWNLHLLSQVFLPDIISTILGKPVLQVSCVDEVVWSLTTSGKFPLASAFQEVH